MREKLQNSNAVRMQAMTELNESKMMALYKKEKVNPAEFVHFITNAFFTL